MTTRVQQLVDQAKSSMPAGLAPEAWLELYHQKFAELMVKKFDDILMLEQLDCIGNMDKKAVLLLDKIRERTKTYFGVEE
jgi:hypothetical protein